MDFMTSKECEIHSRLFTNRFKNLHRFLAFQTIIGGGLVDVGINLCELEEAGLHKTFVCYAQQYTDFHLYEIKENITKK